MSDPVVGLREIARVTRPGGRVVAAVWDHAGGAGPLSTFWRAVADREPAPTTSPGSPARSKVQLVDLGERAGLTDVEPHTVTVRVGFETFEEWWQPYERGCVLRGPMSGGSTVALVSGSWTTCVVSCPTRPSSCLQPPGASAPRAPLSDGPGSWRRFGGHGAAPRQVACQRQGVQRRPAEGDAEDLLTRLLVLGPRGEDEAVGHVADDADDHRRPHGAFGTAERADGADREVAGAVGLGEGVVGGLLLLVGGHEAAEVAGFGQRVHAVRRGCGGHQPAQGHRHASSCRVAPGTIGNPFYAMVEGPLLIPMLVLATMAAIIASQALISGVFSLTRQAMQLGFWPRVTIIHTSAHTEGQIYIPEMNWLLMVGCIVLAQVGNLPLNELTELNPHLFRQVAPRDYWVWVPAGQGRALQQAYTASEFRQRGGFGTYRVREGESLSGLAQRRGSRRSRSAR